MNTAIFQYDDQSTNSGCEFCQYIYTNISLSRMGGDVWVCARFVFLLQEWINTPRNWFEASQWKLSGKRVKMRANLWFRTHFKRIEYELASQQQLDRESYSLASTSAKMKRETEKGGFFTLCGRVWYTTNERGFGILIQFAHYFVLIVVNKNILHSTNL